MKQVKFVDPRQQELNDKFDELKDTVRDIGVDGEHRSKELVETITTKFMDLLESVRDNIQVNELDTEPIIKAINAINVNPIVNIPKHETKVVLKQSLYEEYVPANCDMGDTNSYMGHVNQSGGWFIMLMSGTQQCSYKYIFGSGNFTKAWANRTKLDYKRFDEAINEA